MRPRFLTLLLLPVCSAWAGDAPRTVARVYELRAWAGAPPVYTHSVEADVDSVPDACLSCHKKGTDGAPVTPHPELPECRQCHVRRAVETLFKPTDWTAVAPPQRGRRALVSSPPVMPHEPTGFRTRCVVCHGPPHPAKELQSKHPERATCLQCHVPATTTAEWSRSP